MAAGSLVGADLIGDLAERGGFEPPMEFPP